MPGARQAHAATATSGALYTLGGLDSSWQISASVYRYDGTTWTTLASLPAPRAYLAAGLVNGQLHAVGGLVVTNVYRYSGSGGTWTEVVGLPAPRLKMAAAALNGVLYAIGGSDGSIVTNVYRYDGTNWTEVAGLPAPREGLAAGVLNGALYVVGGGATNMYRYPAITGAYSGVVPSNGVCAGGYPVTITGTGLGNGSDITNVKLCGVTATILPGQSSTQVVVTAGTSVSPGLGNVAVSSTSQGATIKSNGFTYYNPSITAAGGAHGTVTPSGVVDVVSGGSTNFVVVADVYYHIGSLSTNG